MLTRLRIIVEINVYKKNNPDAFPILLHHPDDIAAEFEHPDFNIRSTELMPKNTFVIIDRDYWDKEFAKMDLIRFTD